MVLLFSKIALKPVAAIGCKRFSAGGSVARQQRHHALDHPTHCLASPAISALGCTVPSWREHFNG